MSDVSMSCPSGLGVALHLGRSDAGEVLASMGVDIQAVPVAKVAEFSGPQHHAHGHESFPAELLFGHQGPALPFGMRAGERVSVFHEGNNLLVALGLVPGQPDVGDAPFAQAMRRLFVHAFPHSVGVA